MCGFALLIFSFLLNVPFGLAETQLFHFHRISKNEGQGGGSTGSPEPPLDPPLQKIPQSKNIAGQSWVGKLVHKQNQGM